VETEKKLTADQVMDMLRNAPGITLLDELSSQIYPLPADCEGKDDVFVGRIREDISCEKGIDMWVVSDNLRKGAALNAVQISELLFCSPS
jgi:aspartate-semialdehyde dehydrogenase